MIKKKLVWKDKTERTLLKSTVVSHFAMWAVRQSPYMYPENLEKGIEEFNHMLDSDNGFIETTCKELEESVCAAIAGCETVMSWNNAKDGSQDQFVFVSRIDKPAPDHDIICVHALARNIAHSVWLELCYDDGAFEDGAHDKSTWDLSNLGES